MVFVSFEFLCVCIFVISPVRDVKLGNVLQAQGKELFAHPIPNGGVGVPGIYFSTCVHEMRERYFCKNFLLTRTGNIKFPPPPPNVESMFANFVYSPQHSRLPPIVIWQSQRKYVDFPIYNPH